MSAMREAIMKRRMKLAGDVDFEDRKDANLNPDEGSQDDLTIAQDDMMEDVAEGESGEDGLAPDVSAEANDMGGEVVEETNVPIPQMGERSRIESFFAQDDVGKPGIRGKAANKMMAALNKMKK